MKEKQSSVLLEPGIQAADWKVQVSDNVIIITFKNIWL
jgi:hypothetical protein